MITVKNPATGEEFHGHALASIARRIGGRRAEIRHVHRDYPGNPQEVMVVRRNLHDQSAYDVIARLIVIVGGWAT